MEIYAVSVTYCKYDAGGNALIGSELSVGDHASRAEAIGAAVIRVREKYKAEEGWMLGHICCVHIDKAATP